MKKKVLIGLIASATIGTAMASPAIMSNQNTTHNDNEILMVNNNIGTATNEAVVINGNSNMNLYALSNGKGIVSNLSKGEMLTIFSHKGSYCKVRVQETGTVGYISVANMQNIINGTSAKLTNTSGNGFVVNVSTRLRIRSNPSINANITSYLSNGTQFSILGKQGQWYKVIVNGEIGFVYGEYVNTNTSSVVNKSSSQESSISNSSSKANNTISNSNTDSISTDLHNSSNVVNNSITVSNNTNSISSTNSSCKVKNVIVKTKGTSSSKVNINSNSISSSSSVSDVTQINKTVKIYLVDGGVTGMGVASSPTAKKYSYYMPKGISTVYVISENLNDGLSCIKYNGQYGYVNTIVLKDAEHFYLTKMNESKQEGIINSKNNNTGTSIPLYGQLIPGTNQMSCNVIVKNQGKPDATILPKVAQGFTNRIYQSEGAYFTNIEIPQYTCYSQLGGENNVYKYYIVSPQLINTENLKVGTNINPNTLTITSSTKNIKSIQAVGYLSNGLIIGIDSNGQQVYLPASSLKKTIKFAPTQLNVMLKNATINTQETIQVYDAPVAVKSISTIGNTISNKNLRVVVVAQANGYSEILFGTSNGIFEGWVSTSYLTIS